MKKAISYANFDQFQFQKNATSSDFFMKLYLLVIQYSITIDSIVFIEK